MCALVTGVQACALPICVPDRPRFDGGPRRLSRRARPSLSIAMMRQILDRFGMAVAALAVFVPDPACAHAGESHGVGQTWTLDPAHLVPMAAFAGLYAAGVFRLRHRPGIGSSAERPLGTEGVNTCR